MGRGEAVKEEEWKICRCGGQGGGEGGVEEEKEGESEGGMERGRVASSQLMKRK